MKSGVNRNGVQYTKVGNTYYCIFYFGGEERIKSFTDVPKSFINNLSFFEMR